MSKQFDSKYNPNLIMNPEQAAQELFGYDDETLLRELKEAELELEQMKAEDPELEARIAGETEDGFKALMQKIHAENIKPVTEREYSEKKKEDERKVTLLRPVLKVMFVAAAIMVLLNGMGIVVSARKEFEYSYIKTGKMKNEVVWQNGDYTRLEGQLMQAYQKVSDELGIRVLTLGYKPENMLFKEVTIDKGRALITFSYGDKLVYLRETRDPADKITDFIASDRKETGTETVYNPWLSHEFIIEENKLDDKNIEYSTQFKRDGVYYYFEGMMDREIFINIVKSLDFLQE